MCLTFLTFRWETLSFGLLHISFTLTAVTIFILLSTGIGPWEACPAGLTLIVAALVYFLFGLMLIVATPELLSLICWKVFIKTVICIPISVLILFIFLDWFSARTSAELPSMFACFAVNFSRMVEKHKVDFHQCFA